MKICNRFFLSRFCDPFFFPIFLFILFFYKKNKNNVWKNNKNGDQKARLIRTNTRERDSKIFILMVKKILMEFLFPFPMYLYIAADESWWLQHRIERNSRIYVTVETCCQCISQLFRTKNPRVRPQAYKFSVWDVSKNSMCFVFFLFFF